jgi:pimeloyl-ACP methyl ester carboxylesterase
MADRISGDSDTGDRFVRLDDGDMHVVEEGKPHAPAVLLIHGTGASTDWWDPVVGALARAYRVIRVDLLGHGRSSSPAGGYDIPTQARRVGAALDRLGVSRLVAIGHSTGSNVATALAEQRPGMVTALALIDMGPTPDAFIDQGPASRLLQSPVLGSLLWRLRTAATIRKAMASGFTRPVTIPDAFIKATLGMTYRAIAGTSRASADYLRQRSLDARLAALALPVLVIFGSDDRRWRSSSADAYRVLPGVRVEMLQGIGHTPMMEDPQTTATLLLDFVAATGHPD